MPTIQKLHPTLKKCKCGFIGSRSKLYKHFEIWKHIHNTSPDIVTAMSGGPNNTFYSCHGEVPLNENYETNNK